MASLKLIYPDFSQEDPLGWGRPILLPMDGTLSFYDDSGTLTRLYILKESEFKKYDPQTKLSMFFRRKPHREDNILTWSDITEMSDAEHFARKFRLIYQKED